MIQYVSFKVNAEGKRIIVYWEIVNLYIDSLYKIYNLSADSETQTDINKLTKKKLKHHEFVFNFTQD